jgi:hypothetical protein
MAGPDLILRNPTWGFVMRLSRLPAPVAAAAMLIALAGCGSSGGTATEATNQDDTALVAMQRVADNTRNVDSASYTFSLAGTGSLAIGAKGSGAYQTKPALAMKMVFDEITVAGQAMPGGMEQRIVGDTMYLRMGLLGGILGGKTGSSWMKVPLSSAGSEAGLDGMLSQARQVDPREQLQLLIASNNVHKVGTEKVNGVDTTHYAAELDSNDLANESKLDATTRDQLQKAYSSAGVGKIGVDVWVDSDDQARRFVTTAPTSAGDVRMTLDFTDYGKALDIAVPDGATDAGISGLFDNLVHSAEPKAS